MMDKFRKATAEVCEKAKVAAKYKNGGAVIAALGAIFGCMGLIGLITYFRMASEYGGPVVISAMLSAMRALGLEYCAANAYGDFAYFCARHRALLILAGALGLTPGIALLKGKDVAAWCEKFDIRARAQRVWAKLGELAESMQDRELQGWVTAILGYIIAVRGIRGFSDYARIINGVESEIARYGHSFYNMGYIGEATRFVFNSDVGGIFGIFAYTCACRCCCWASLRWRRARCGYIWPRRAR